MKTLLIAMAAALICSVASAESTQRTAIPLPPQPDKSKIGSRGLIPPAPAPKREIGKLVLQPGLRLVIEPPSRGL